MSSVRQILSDESKSEVLEDTEKYHFLVGRALNFILHPSLYEFVEEQMTLFLKQRDEVKEKVHGKDALREYFNSNRARPSDITSSNVAPPQPIVAINRYQRNEVNFDFNTGNWSTAASFFLPDHNTVDVENHQWDLVSLLNLLENNTFFHTERFSAYKIHVPAGPKIKDEIGIFFVIDELLEASQNWSNLRLYKMDRRYLEYVAGLVHSLLDVLGLQDQESLYKLSRFYQSDVVILNGGLSAVDEHAHEAKASHSPKAASPKAAQKSPKAASPKAAAQKSPKAAAQKSPKAASPKAAAQKSAKAASPKAAAEKSPKAAAQKSPKAAAQKSPKAAAQKSAKAASPKAAAQKSPKAAAEKSPKSPKAAAKKSAKA